MDVCIWYANATVPLNRNHRWLVAEVEPPPPTPPPIVVRIPFDTNKRYGGACLWDGVSNTILHAAMMVKLLVHVPSFYATKMVACNACYR